MWTNYLFDKEKRSVELVQLQVKRPMFLNGHTHTIYDICRLLSLVNLK